MTAPSDPTPSDRDPGDEAPDSPLRVAATVVLLDALPFLGLATLARQIASLLPAPGVLP